MASKKKPMPEFFKKGSATEDITKGMSKKVPAKGKKK